jgi:hypothetical protein
MEYQNFICLTNLHLEDESKHVVEGIYWHNSIDDAHPYASGLNNPKNKKLIPWNVSDFLLLLIIV